MKNDKAYYKTKAIRFLKELSKSLFLWLILVTSIIEASRVPTGSMKNTILPGDFLLINKFVYGIATPRNIPLTNIELPFAKLPGIKSPKLNDIVVFRYPGELDMLVDDQVQFYVKRCVGTPGDTIEIINKVLYVNNKENPIPPNINYEQSNILPENYIEPRIYSNGDKFNKDNYGKIIVPKKGDVIELTLENVNYWKPVIDRELEKRTVLVSNNKILINGIEVNNYIIKKDYYFFVGDNRDNSLDSRYWGFVPERDIIGQPLIVYWSWDSSIPFSRPLDLLASVRWNRLLKLID